MPIQKVSCRKISLKLLLDSQFEFKGHYQTILMLGPSLLLDTRRIFVSYKQTDLKILENCISLYSKNGVISACWVET